MSLNWHEFVDSALKSNQFAQGGLVLMVVGGILTYCRRVPGTIWRWVKNRLLFTVEIDNTDQSFHWMQAWLASKGKGRFVQAKARFDGDLANPDVFHGDSSRRQGPTFDLSPRSFTTFRFKGSRVMAWLNKEPVQNSNEYRQSITLQFLAVRGARPLAQALLTEAYELVVGKSGKIVEIWSASLHGDWQLADRRPVRPIETLVLADGVQELIFEDAKKFLTEKKWYQAMGVPWRRGYLLHGPAGSGKCLGKGTPVLMHDGRIKPVEEIVGGDMVMGPDSKPRRVLGTTSGIDQMYRVLPVKGDPYVVNSHHVLSLKMTDGAAHFRQGEIVNIGVKDYLAQSNNFRNHAKGYRVGVLFEYHPVEIEPYFLGLWLGDGTTETTQVVTADHEIQEYLAGFARRCGLKLIRGVEKGKATMWSVSSGCRSGPIPPQYKNWVLSVMRLYGLAGGVKHIPDSYKMNSREVRLEVLAGLIDSDGSLASGHYDYITESRRLADDVLFLCRSLGLAAYMAQCRKSCVVNSGYTFTGTYYRIGISGDLSVVPCRVARKQCPPRRQKKSVLHTGITVEPIGPGEYYGFQVDGDGLFLLGDFTVTHNSTVAHVLASELGLNLFTMNLASVGDGGLERSMQNVPEGAILLIEDIDTAFQKRKKSQETHVSFAGLLNALDGVAAKEGRIVIMTTNHKHLLDPALIRPGRADVHVLLDDATAEQARRMFDRFFPEAPEGLSGAFAGKWSGRSMAAIQNTLLTHRHDPAAAAATEPPPLPEPEPAPTLAA